MAKAGSDKRATKEDETRTTAKASAAKKPAAKKPAAAKPAPTKRKTKPVEPDSSVSAVEEAKVEPSEVAAPEPEPVQPPEPVVSTPRPESGMDDSLLPANRGKVAVFGGPKDRSIKPDDKVALPIGRHFTCERVRSLDARSFYCSMRWNYRINHMTPEEGKRWWANKKLLVINSANGKRAVVRAVDYGPHEKTGLDIGLSPGAAEALEAAVGDEVEIFFAEQKSSLGPVKEIEAKE
jgi:hypothetical protein